MTSHLDIVRANYSRRTEIQGELRSIDEAATADNREYTEAETATITEKRSELEAIDGRITSNLEMEVRSQEIGDGIGNLLGAMIDRESGDVVDARSIGQRFIDRDELRSWVENGANGTSPLLTADAEFRAVTDLTTSGAAIQNQRLTRVGRDVLSRRTFLLDLLPSIPVSNGVAEYVQDQTPNTDLTAAETAEGGAKPKSGITLVPITEAIATIPAWANITRQTAADAPQMQGYLDGKLRYQVKRRADSQSINGNGVSPNIKGLLNRSGILTYAPGAETRYRSVRRGIRLMEDAEAVPEIIVVNPADAEIFDLSNDTTAGLHAVDSQGGIAGGQARSMWGLTQVRSTAIASGTALLIDPMAVAVLDRQQITAYLTDSHASNFTSNILTLLLEARLGLALFDPQGVCKITFNGTT